jgi:hypothetical protein
MKWLLWREYRLNRWILVMGGVLVLLPYLGAAISLLFQANRDTAYFFAYIASTIFSAMTLAMLGGNAIAGERADRSAEFVAYLPLGSMRVIASKLLLALTSIVVLCVVNLLILMPPVATWPAEQWPTTGNLPERFQWSVLLVSASLLIYGVSWFASSILSSPVLATCIGWISAFLSSAPAEEAGAFFPIVPIVFAILAVGCLWFGSLYYVRDTKPWFMQWHAETQHTKGSYTS